MAGAGDKRGGQVVIVCVASPKAAAQVNIHAETAQLGAGAFRRDGLLCHAYVVW